MSVELHSRVNQPPAGRADPPVSLQWYDYSALHRVMTFSLFLSSRSILPVLPQLFVEPCCVIVHQTLRFRQLYAVDRVIFPISSCSYNGWNSRPELTTICNYPPPEMHQIVLSQNALRQLGIWK